MNNIPSVRASFMEPFYLAAKEAGTVNKKTIAHALDISPRTIQRRLEQSSTSFSTIIDLVRFDKAQRLIKYSDLTMLEISLMLGHQNASSFTRSFRRLSGVSPKKFRLFGIEES